MTRWKIKFDIKIMGIYFWLYVITIGICFALTTQSNRYIQASYGPKFSIQSNAFMTVDFIIPAVCMFCLVALLGECLESINGQYIFTLPVTTGELYVFRLLRMMFIFILPYSLYLFITHIKINQVLQADIPFHRYLFISMPVFIFLAGLAALTITVTRNVFYSLVISGGFVLLDIGTSGNLLGEKSLFINIFSSSNNDMAVIANRLTYLFIGCIFIVIPYFVMRLNIYRKAL